MTTDNRTQPLTEGHISNPLGILAPTKGGNNQYQNLDLGIHAVARVIFFARASIIGFGLALASGCASTSAVFSLSSSDNLDIWRTASGSQQAELCENMSSWLAEPVSSPSGLCSCISTTADNGGYDFMIVSEVAEVCAGLLKADGG